MENLPAELIELISLYLTSEDVFNCSNVSAQWSEVFNLDGVWKRFLTYDRTYFKNKSSRLNYTLSRAELGIEPCRCKDLVLKESFIKRNVMQGKFLTEEINIGASYVECVEEDLDGKGNHWLFLSIHEGLEFEGIHKIQVWNLNQTSYLQSSIVTSFNTSRPFDSVITVFDDRVFYVKQDIVWVYEFSYPKFEFRFLLKIEPSKCSYPKETLMSNKMICLRSNILSFTYTNIHINHNLHPSFEMWNHDGVQVAHSLDKLDLWLDEEHQTGQSSSCICVVFVKIMDGNNILVVYQNFIVLDGYSFVLKVFDCSKSVYNDILTEKCGQLQSFDVHGKIAVILYEEQNLSGQKLECINVEIGTKLFCCDAKFVTPCRSNIASIQFVLNGDLVVISNNLLYNFNITKMGLKSKVCLKLTERLGDVRALNNNFIVLFNPKSTGRGSYELFNYETGGKMYNIPLGMPYLSFSSWKDKSLPANIIAYSNPNMVFARKAQYNSIFVIHFW